MPSGEPGTVVVAGATGNIGPFVVRALLERGDRVAALSRAQERLDDLRDHLDGTVDASALDRLHGVAGDLADPREAVAVRERVAREVGPARGVVAAVGDFVTVPTLLDAPTADLRRALESYLVGHHAVLRTFGRDVEAAGGTYMLLQGQLAFELHPELGTHLISIATAGQHMLFRALAQELDESPARVVELVGHALVRERRTVAGSPISGLDVGRAAAHLAAGGGTDVHGRSIQLRSPQDVAELGVEPA